MKEPQKAGSKVVWVSLTLNFWGEKGGGRTWQLNVFCQDDSPFISFARYGSPTARLWRRQGTQLIHL